VVYLGSTTQDSNEEIEVYVPFGFPDHQKMDAEKSSLQGGDELKITSHHPWERRLGVATDDFLFRVGG